MKGEHYSGRTRSTGTVVFYSIYFVLLAAALSAAVVGLGKLWEFLQHYEACQIYHTIDAVAEELNSGNLGLLYSGIEGDISPYEGEDAARRQLSERLTGEFTLKKNIKESTKENPVYTVLCGGEPAAFARLAQTGADELYGFEIYGVEQVYGVQLVQNENVRLSLPTGCTAKINGVELSSWSEHETAEIPEAAEFGEYLTSAPQNGAYSCGLPVTDSAAAEQAKEFALEFSKLYSKYIANDVYFSSISGYIPQGTELYSNLSTYEGQFYTYHSGYDFTEEQVRRVTQYSADCFAVRVSYVHNVYYGGETYSYPADNTIYAVNTEAGWKAAGLTMN